MAVRRVELAYRELIGSLYESWTIGIERVYSYYNTTALKMLKTRFRDERKRNR